MQPEWLRRCPNEYDRLCEKRIVNLIQRGVAVAACVFTPVLCSAQSPHSSRDAQKRGEYARSFEQLQVFVEPGDTISVREASGDEFSARISDLTSTELVVMVDGRRRAFQPDDVIRIRQRRGDSLANGTWLGFGIGAGLGVVAVATDDSGFMDSAGFAVLAAAVYGGIGAGIGVGVDALIRHRRVIYDHQPGGAPGVAIIPLLGVKSAGAMIALRF
jgi:hypothetical protein